LWDTILRKGITGGHVHQIFVRLQPPFFWVLCVMWSCRNWSRSSFFSVLYLYCYEDINFTFCLVTSPSQGKESFLVSLILVILTRWVAFDLEYLYCCKLEILEEIFFKWHCARMHHVNQFQSRYIPSLHFRLVPNYHVSRFSLQACA
jgi:hypothetical protein